MEKNDTIILVCAHKKDNHTKNEGVYHAIQVGKKLHPEIELGFLNDDKGDNISDKNKRWCELTALYWGWKNLPHIKYCGLCHYRRYFDVTFENDSAASLLKQHDIVVVDLGEATQMSVNKSYLTYALSQEDFYIYLDSLIHVWPQYKDLIIDYFYNYNRFTPFTMFIARKQIYDDFCEFIFPVLNELDKRIPHHCYSRQNRVIGYFGEASLGLFIYCKKLRANRVPFVMCEDVNHTFNSKLSLIKRIYHWLYVEFVKMKHKKVKTVVVPSDVKAGLANDGISLVAIG